MANDRLYIVNTKEKFFVCIAKGWGAEWQFGNPHKLQEFLSESFQSDEMIVGREGDEDFYNKYIANAEYVNLNKESGWQYFDKVNS